MFKDISQDILKDMGAEEALSRAFAYMCGQKDVLSQRSLLFVKEGFVTYQVKTKKDFYRMNYIITFLKRSFEPSVVHTIRSFKMGKDNRTMVFDVPEKNCYIFDKYIELH